MTTQQEAMPDKTMADVDPPLEPAEMVADTTDSQVAKDEVTMTLAVHNPQEQQKPAPRKAPPAPLAPMLPASWAQPTVPIIEEEFDDDDIWSSEGDDSEMRSMITTRLSTESMKILDEEPVTKNRLIEFLAVSEGLKRSCWTLPLTLALWIAFMLLLINHANTADSFACAHTLEDAAWRASAMVPNARVQNRELELWRIADIPDILDWLQYGFIPLFDDDARIQERQQLIGAVRLTQLRGVNASCELSSQLANFHQGWCHPYDGSPRDYGPTADLDYAFRPRQEHDGREFKAWLDMAEGQGVVERRVERLRRDGWLDLNSHSVAVEALFLNPEERIYSFFSLTFRMHRGGWIERDFEVLPMKADVYAYWFHIFVDMLWAWLLFILLFQASRQLWKARRENMLKFYLEDPYNWIDWMCIVVGALIIIFFWVLAGSLDSFTSNVAALGALPDQAWYEVFGPKQVETVRLNLDWHNQVDELISDFNFIAWYVIRHRLIGFWYVIVVLLRFFRGFTGQPRIAVLMQTTWLAADFLIHYLVLFTVVFATFAVSGHILFGEQLLEWSSLGRSFLQLAQVMFGNYHYETFHDVAPFTAGCWFFAFYITAMLLMLGICSVGILHQYLNVKERLGEPGWPLWKQVKDMLTEMWWSDTYDGSNKTAPDGPLLAMMSRGMSPKDMQRLGRYKLDRRLRTRKDIVDQEHDKPVDIHMLMKQGCDKSSAERLINRVRRAGHHVGVRTTPGSRAMLMSIRHMNFMHTVAEQMQSRIDAQAKWGYEAVERIDIKHAKSRAVAARVRSAQTLPEGWTEQWDENGRRYLVEKESGLTGWTLPRGMF